MQMPVLPHHKLDAYRVAKEIAKQVHEARIRDTELRDQATRAAKSNCSLRLQQSEERPTPSSRAFRCICSVIHPRPRNPEHDFVYRVFRRNLPAI
jgi:hypothetical protein